MHASAPSTRATTERMPAGAYARQRICPALYSVAKGSACTMKREGLGNVSTATGQLAQLAVGEGEDVVVERQHTVVAVAQGPRGKLEDAPRAPRIDDHVQVPADVVRDACVGRLCEDV